MDKLLYLFDGNFYFFKTISVIGVFDKERPKFLIGDSKSKREDDKNSLINKLTMDFCADIRKSATFVDEIIITFDDYSWRNDFFEGNGYKYVKEFLPGFFDKEAGEHGEANTEFEVFLNNLSKVDIDYKGTRSKEQTVDWDFMYQIFQDWLEDMTKLAGIKWVRIKGCEGDDLIFAIATLYVAMGRSVMIYSGDNDLKQLVTHNVSNNAFVIHHKKTEKKLVMSQDTAKYFMNTDSVLRDKINTFSQINDIKLIAENPFDTIFTKVLIGDEGDNVLPIIQEPRRFKSGKKKGQLKTEKIGKRVIDKVKSEIDYTKYDFLDLFNDDFLRTLANSVLRNYKPIHEFDVEDIINNIKINRDLMFLHINCIPQSIYETMLTWVEQTKDTNDLIIKDLFSYKTVLERNPNYTKSTESNGSSANFFNYIDF